MSEFRHLDNVIFSHFNQDFDLIGNSIEAILADYNKTLAPDDIAGLKEEIHRFLTEDRFEALFAEKYGFDVDPGLWGHTVESFLQAVLAEL